MRLVIVTRILFISALACSPLFLPPTTQSRDAMPTAITDELILLNPTAALYAVSLLVDGPRVALVDAMSPYSKLAPKLLDLSPVEALQTTSLLITERRMVLVDSLRGQPFTVKGVAGVVAGVTFAGSLIVALPDGTKKEVAAASVIRQVLASATTRRK